MVLTLLARRVLAPVGIALAATNAASQEDPIEQAAPIVQASQTTHHLEELEKQVSALLKRFQAAQLHADQSVKAAKSEVQKSDSTIDKSTAEQRIETATLAASTLEQLTKTLESVRSKTSGLRQAASKIAKSERGRKLAELQRKQAAEITAHEQRVQEQEHAFTAAANLRSLKDVQKAYKRIQNACSKPPLGDTLEGRRMKALALYLQADRYVRAYGSGSGLRRSAAEQGLRTAVKMANEAVETLKKEAKDAHYAGSWGSSLSAAALRREIGIHGAFYERYMRLKKESREPKRFQEMATKAYKSAMTRYEELGRRFSNATTDDGRYTVDATHEDVQRMFSVSLPPVIR